MKFLILLSIAAVALATNVAETEYFSNGGDLVAFYVYRVHDGVEGLNNDNAASLGGEIGFLANEYQYSDGTIARDCIVMINSSNAAAAATAGGPLNEFSSYACCNGGSCGGCGYAGSGSGAPNMPGRSYQLYPPPGAPATCNQNDNCAGVPGVSCGGECSGWWYSFASQGKCTNGQQPSATGCTWYNAHIMQTVQFADLIATGQYYTCELSTNQPPGGCSGYLGWTQFMSGVNALANLFQTNTQTVVLNPATQTYVNVSVQAFPDPRHMCQAPCPAGSFSTTGYLTYATQCQLCPSGSYSSNSASTSCTPCPNGGSSPVGSTSYTQCSGGSSDGQDGQDAQDADGLLANDNSAGQVARKSSLPTYAVAVIVLSSLLVAAAVGIIIVRSVRRRVATGAEMHQILP